VLSEKSAAVQTVATAVFGLGAQYGLMLPYSRKHEYEADYMGLVFMEIAGYDSESAVGFWTKMSSAGGSVPEFLSTHPSDGKRIAQIRQRIPEARSAAASLK
jgi:predicted Zn-dependent protease